MPVTLVYTGIALSSVALSTRFGVGALGAMSCFLAGIAGWTLLEYCVHRWVLHGRFPDGPGAAAHWAHVAFDTLHTEHHARPWDGNHINGTLKDTAPYVALLGLLSLMAPAPGAPVLWAGLIQAYVVEEWIHHAVHFQTVYGLRRGYWRYISRHHTYHHSPRGGEVAYGLTNGMWDLLLGTRIPGRDRQLLYSRRE